MLLFLEYIWYPLRITIVQWRLDRLESSIKKLAAKHELKIKIINTKSQIDNYNVPDDIVHTNRAGGPMR